MSTDNDIVVRLRESDDGYFMRHMFTEAADEIERLRAERDEARQIVRTSAYQTECTHIQKLVKTINTLLIERDEARRYACDNNPFRLTKWQLAKIKGWDCFDLENGNA